MQAGGAKRTFSEMNASSDERGGAESAITPEYVQNLLENGQFDRVLDRTTSSIERKKLIEEMVVQYRALVAEALAPVDGIRAETLQSLIARLQLKFNTHYSHRYRTIFIEYYVQSGAVGTLANNALLSEIARCIREAKERGDGSLELNGLGEAYIWIKIDTLIELLEPLIQGQLRSLSLQNSGLVGEIPKALFILGELQILNLADNHLTGDIPAALGTLSQLEWLILTNNELTGEIPAALGDLERLQNLDLEFNELTGDIPVALRRPGLMITR